MRKPDNFRAVRKHERVGVFILECLDKSSVWLSGNLDVELAYVTFLHDPPSRTSVEL